MSITKDFNNDLWDKDITGTGTVTVGDSGASILISSPSGSTARARYYTVGWPGERLTFTVLARNVPSALTGHAGIFIDSDIGALKNVQQIKSEFLQMYTVEIVVPFHVVGPQRIAFGVGSYSTLDGQAEFMNPVINRSSNGVIMEGMLEFAAGGGWLLREDYQNYNVGAITFDAVSKTLRVNPSVPYNFQDQSGHQFRPIVQVTGAPDGNTTQVYSWTGSVTGITSIVSIQACASTPVDLAGGTVAKRFCSFRVTTVGSG